jgi:hypothetical protein
MRLRRSADRPCAKCFVHLYRLNEDGRKLAVGKIEAGNPLELVGKWIAFIDRRAWRLVGELSRYCHGAESLPFTCCR